MAIANWPSYGKYLAPITQRPSPVMLDSSEMEHGPPKRAEMPGRQILATELRVLLTAAEYISWRDWYTGTIAHGAANFNWTDPMDGVTKTAWIKKGRFSVRTIGSVSGPGVHRVIELTVEAYDA